MPSDLTGQRFGRLVALRRTRRGAYWCWHCQCDCGNTCAPRSDSLRTGDTQSCGCLQREGLSARRRSHGQSTTDTYAVWRTMLARCRNPKNRQWHNYGGRGITVCDRWQTFEHFYADMGNSPEGLTLERNDVNGDYTKANCRWATWKEQANNKRNNLVVTFRGESHTLRDWSRMLNIVYETLWSRLYTGWSVEQAFTKPPRRRVQEKGE